MIEFHHEIMPEEQLRIWMVCAGPTSKWKAYLAGGTSIALHLGHRRSVDFDWFTPETIAWDTVVHIWSTIVPQLSHTKKYRR